jgi:hypothetical protein
MDWFKQYSQKLCPHIVTVQLTINSVQIGHLHFLAVFEFKGSGSSRFLLIPMSVSNFSIILLYILIKF